MSSISVGRLFDAPQRSAPLMFPVLIKLHSRLMQGLDGGSIIANYRPWSRNFRDNFIDFQTLASLFQEISPDYVGDVYLGGSARNLIDSNIILMFVSEALPRRG